jgi:hypothetical protein
VAFKPQLASVAPTTPSLEVEDAVRGYSAPSWKVPFRRQHNRVVERAAAEATVGKAQAQRSGIGGFIWYS